MKNKLIKLIKNDLVLTILSIILILYIAFASLSIVSICNNKYKLFVRNQFATIDVDSLYLRDARYSFEIKNPYIPQVFDTVLVLSKKSGYVLYYNKNLGKVRHEELWYFKSKTKKLQQ